MRSTASIPTDQFPDLLRRLPADLDLDRLAHETKAIQRKRKVGDGAGLLRLALARGPGGFPLHQTAGWVSLLGTADLSNPGVHDRLKQAVGFLAALVGLLLAEGARRPVVLARPCAASGRWCVSAFNRGLLLTLVMSSSSH